MAALLFLMFSFCGQISDLEFNIPAEIRRFFEGKSDLAKYEISSRINPFYLRGDFDGDGGMDFAVLVLERKSKRRGLIILNPKRGSFAVIGAGQNFLRSDGYNYIDFGFKAWSVYSKSKIEQSLEEETPPPKLLAEAILVEWPEAGSGIIYWNGIIYKWYHLGG